MIGGVRRLHVQDSVHAAGNPEGVVVAQFGREQPLRGVLVGDRAEEPLDALFDEATFSSAAMFGEATFSGDALFDGASGLEMRALCKVPDGSTVVSAERTIQISPPHNEQDRQAGDLLIGSQQGTLLALLGSDAPQLSDGNAALDRLIATHPDHPLAVYALMVKGTNAGRHFQTLGKNGLSVRPADTATSIEQLGAVVETTLDPGTDAGVDNITLNETMRSLARAHARAHDLKQADAVLDQMVETFREKHVPPPVLATIAEQAETTRTQLHDQA
ncbi:pentapeptide repeat-containing protein [Nonomuraea sp. WAC 01424]|uniref:pentapeptide repeat-containing protein n=1 Tax=Nonomuraea sp. WAC 01424 TaxID=2203200 RepID=UPI000F773D4A|nr:pentapeptide repeat-containing protein [Nonomuraea sp. WAC 01424]